MPKLHIKIRFFHLQYNLLPYHVWDGEGEHVKLKAIGPSKGHILIRHIQYWHNLWLHTVTCKQ